MKSLSKSFLVIFLLISISAPVYAGFISVNKLVKYMREFEKVNTGSKDINYHYANRYVSYVIGVYDTLELYGIIYNPLIAKTSQGQIASIVAKFLKNNPERWHEPAADLVRDVLIKAFPCKKQKKIEDPFKFD